MADFVFDFSQDLVLGCCIRLSEYNLTVLSSPHSLSSCDGHDTALGNLSQTRSATEASWYEPDPKQSLDLNLKAEYKMKTVAEIRSINAGILALAISVNLFAASSHGQETNVQLMEAAKATFGIISAPTQEELDRPMVALGRHLFWDERLSANGKIACASCHAPSSWAQMRKDFR